MNCPYCETEMEKGNLMCSNGERIYWQEQKGKTIKVHYTKCAIENNGGIVLTNNNDVGNPILTWNCKNCNKVIVEY